ncbi:hypothetical protein ACWDR0_19780 [Streptomyces sp. NPDC003691]
MTACAVQPVATRWKVPGGEDGPGHGTGTGNEAGYEAGTGYGPAGSADPGPGTGISGSAATGVGGDRLRDGDGPPVRGVTPADRGTLTAPPAAPAAAVPAPALTLSADGAYAAGLAGTGDALYPERWTLDGPEPYAVPLPLHQPEERDTTVLPLADGRVLIHRRTAGHRLFSLLYPAGRGTGELVLGSVPAPHSGYGPAVLLPPAPDGTRAYLLVPGPGPGHSTGHGPGRPGGGPGSGGTVTTVWRVAGHGAAGPERVAEVPGRCTGGVWLDRTGRLLALDRQREPGGPVKAVAVDLERGGEVSPLLQIAPDSNDRLLLAAPDSGLLVVRSDAPGEDRIGWGVLGSDRPVRFPECLRPAGGTLTPFAVQPGQILQPERCSVAFTVRTSTSTSTSTSTGTGSRAGAAVWCPEGRELHRTAVPDGWFPGTGRWTPEGVLHLPYATPGTPCGVARLTPLKERATGPGAPAAGKGAVPGPGRRPAAALRPVPLQQAPLVGRTQAG